MGEYLDYQRDTLRYKYFVEESKEHQAKLEIRTYQWLVEKYTEPGDVILDPMSGIGTVHVAASMGRSTIGIELSPRFVEIQRMNIERLRETVGIHADTLVLEGDCRRYLPWPLPGLEPSIMGDFPTVDCIIFSPPYADIEKSGTTTGFVDPTTGEKIKAGGFGYSDQQANVGNITIYPLYLNAMRNIYRICNRSLKVGQYLISVCKDKVERNERVYISKDNVRMGIETGFTLEDWHIRNAGKSIRTAVPKKRRVEKGIDRPELEILNEDLLILRKVSNA